LSKAIVVPTSAVQRGPAGTFQLLMIVRRYCNAKPIVVYSKNESDAVIATG